MRSPWSGNYFHHFVNDLVHCQERGINHHRIGSRFQRGNLSGPILSISGEKLVLDFTAVTAPANFELILKSTVGSRLDVGVQKKFGVGVRKNTCSYVAPFYHDPTRPCAPLLNRKRPLPDGWNSCNRGGEATDVR